MEARLGAIASVSDQKVRSVQYGEVLDELNRANGWQVGIHVDAASGGFVMPFQPEEEVGLCDFRVPAVLSMSASGHKFGVSMCGTGWVLWRDRDDLSEHIAISASRLGQGSTQSIQRR